VVDSSNQHYGVRNLKTDLTQEEIVTQILSSNEIIKKQQNQNFTSLNPNFKNLGMLLSSSERNVSNSPSSKYTFITSSWKI
jgi:hypothetical protein